MPEPCTPLLAVEGLHSWYGESHVLHGVNLTVHKGTVASILGRNGAGKSTTLKSIMGLVARRSGSIRRGGTEIIASAPETIARLGIAFCPEERGIFSSLKVSENLMLPPRLRQGGLGVEEIFDLFPNLRERMSTSQGSKLSGGEQQMLAIARILRTGADLLLLDEPTEGLAPVIVQQIGRTVERLKARGFTILLVEQNFRFAARYADHFHLMDHGRIVDQFAASELKARMPSLQRLLGV